jgi:hypothetical protein
MSRWGSRAAADAALQCQTASRDASQHKRSVQFPLSGRIRLIGGHKLNRPSFKEGAVMSRSLVQLTLAGFWFALAVPAFAGTTQVSGIAVFNNDCQPPVGSPPGDLGDYPPIELSGSLQGCWYTYVSESQFNRSGTYIERGTEIFVGCFNGLCGTIETTYTFTAKYVDDTFAEEIHGRCHHPIVNGTEGFEGAEGLVLFKDDVVNLKFDYRGHISVGGAGAAN